MRETDGAERAERALPETGAEGRLGIEAYDISVQAWIVASMAVFENGMPAKKNLQGFRIQSTDTQNDTSMQEVLSGD